MQLRLFENLFKGTVRLHFKLIQICSNYKSCQNMNTVNHILSNQVQSAD